MSILIEFLLIAGVTALFTGVALHLALIPWRRSAECHWTERARLFWTARRCLIWALIAGGVWGSEVGSVWVGSNSYSPLVPGGFVGAVLGTFPSTREIDPRCTFGLWLRQTLWILAVQGGPMLVALILLIFLPNEMDAAAWWFLSGGMVLGFFLAGGWWLPWLMSSKHGHATLAPVQDRLDRISREAGEISGIHPRYLWLADSTIPNAFASPFTGGVGFTTRAMEVLDDEECRGVMIHELAHLTEPRSVRLIRLVGSMSIFVVAFVKPVLEQWGSFGLLGLVIVFLLIQRLLRSTVQRMERRADSAATAMAENSAAYARGIESLYRASHVPAVMPGNKMVHPHLYDRMESAGVTPDYPRPAPPARFSWVSVAFLAMAVAGIMVKVWL